MNADKDKGQPNYFHSAADDNDNGVALQEDLSPIIQPRDQFFIPLFLVEYKNTHVVNLLIRFRRRKQKRCFMAFVSNFPNLYVAIGQSKVLKDDHNLFSLSPSRRSYFVHVLTQRNIKKNLRLINQLE